MGKGRNKKRASNRARRDHDRSVQDSANARDNPRPDRRLNASNQLQPIQAMSDQELHHDLRRLNNSNSLSSRNINTSNPTTTRGATAAIDEVFDEMFGQLLAGLESQIQDLRNHDVLDVNWDELTGPIPIPAYHIENPTTPAYHIENLPTRELTTADQGEAESATCHVCQEDVEVGTLVTWLPKCQHWFCTECLEPWLKEHDTCPTCREVIE